MNMGMKIDILSGKEIKEKYSNDNIAVMKGSRLERCIATITDDTLYTTISLIDLEGKEKLIVLGEATGEEAFIYKIKKQYEGKYLMNETSETYLKVTDIIKGQGNWVTLKMVRVTGTDGDITIEKEHESCFDDTYFDRDGKFKDSTFTLTDRETFLKALDKAKETLDKIKEMEG